MKKLYTILALTLTIGSANAQELLYIQKQNEVEFKRLNQDVARLKDALEQKDLYIRQLEVANEKLDKKVEATNKRVNDLLDLWINFENVSLPNLVSSDKTLSSRINDINDHIKTQTEIWNWGEQSRDCPKIGKHQQVKTVQTPDGNASVRYLCFDGKVIHLNTLSNIPPVE
jgi:chromosome segregation ATPase